MKGGPCNSGDSDRGWSGSRWNGGHREGWSDFGSDFRSSRDFRSNPGDHAERYDGAGKGTPGSKGDREPFAGKSEWDPFGGDRDLFGNGGDRDIFGSNNDRETFGTKGKREPYAAKGDRESLGGKGDWDPFGSKGNEKDPFRGKGDRASLGSKGDRESFVGKGDFGEKGVDHWQPEFSGNGDVSGKGELQGKGKGPAAFAKGGDWGTSGSKGQWPGPGGRGPPEARGLEGAEPKAPAPMPDNMAPPDAAALPGGPPEPQVAEDPPSENGLEYDNFLKFLTVTMQTPSRPIATATTEAVKKDFKKPPVISRTDFFSIKELEEHLIANGR